VKSDPRVRILTAGESTVLLEFTDPKRMRWVAHQLRGAPPPGVLDMLPAARTIMVVAEAASDLAGLRRALAQLAADVDPEQDMDRAAPQGEVVIPVRYDGPDLADVARKTGLSRAELISLHSSTLWRCEYMGFAPGFGYLVSDEVSLDLPRRKQSRTSVPPGSVALAGRYAAVYPRSSPGGWQLIGTTDMAMWDLAAQPPAVIQPDTLVRFVDLDNP